MSEDRDDTPDPKQDSALDVPPAFSEMVGQTLGNYRLVRVVGHGSMGVVFEAQQESLGRRVALKVLPPGLGATEKAIQRFLREAQAVAQLDHENIVDIYEIGESHNTHFYAMQFLEGRSLDRELRKTGPLDPLDAARVVITAARAIHFAHQRGIIHRDLKPANLIRTQEGKVLVTDFGLARPERAASLTDSGAMVGTPLYMSPEQVRGERDKVDRASDVYSLGATLYELLTGEPPFHGSSTQEILQKILEEEPRPVRSLVRTVPAELEIIAMKALEKLPRYRYTSALELAQDLERFLEGEPILARRASIITRAMKRARKHSTISILSVIVVVVTLSMLGMFARSHSREKRRLQQEQEAAAEREFRTEMEEGQRAYLNNGHVIALDHFEAALAMRPDDRDALFAHARTLQSFAHHWQDLLEKRTVGLVSPEWKEAHGSPDAMIEQALTEVRTVLQSRPDDPLANLCQGSLLLNKADREPDPEAQALLYSQGLGHLARAEELCSNSTSPDEWRTQDDLAKVLYTVADAPGRDRGQVSQLLQRALTQSSGAIARQSELAALEERPDDEFMKARARQYLQRSQIFRKLFEVSAVTVDGESRSDYRYLKFCESDALEAQRLWPLADAMTVLTWVNRTRPPEKPGPALSRDRAQPDEAALTFLVSPRSSERSKALEDLMDSFVDGGAFLTNLGGELVNTMLEQGVNFQKVSPEHRQEATFLFGRAQRILAPTHVDIPVSADLLAEAKDCLDQAICLNPNSAEYHSEFAAVCQMLEEWDLVLEHSRLAVGLAPTDPTFLESHTRRLLAAAESMPATDAERRAALDEAAATALTLVRLYGKDRFQPLLDLAQGLLEQTAPGNT